MSGQARLGGYPAKRCPRVTHNDNSPTAPPRPQVAAGLQQLFDDGIAFEALVTEQLLGEHPEALFVDEQDLGWDAAIETTLAAMRDEVPLIVNGRLPEVGGRVGAPDVMVRVDGGYLPVDVKNHRTFGSQKRAVLSYATLADPTEVLEDPDGSGNGPHRGDDTLQLAHYTRMLEGLGFHPGGAMLGGIIGTSDFSALTGARHGITWYDLTETIEQTYSASAPGHRKRRSPLERYDHEFAFRVDVATQAREGGELVRPIGTAECFTCPWQDYCAEVAGPTDPSFAFTSGRLDAREWRFLAERGGDTIEGLAALDVGALAQEFVHHSVNKQAPAQRLAQAVERARMIRDDLDLEPYAEWPEVPRADLELDFDIEWDRAGRIYQWGLRVRSGQDEDTATYQPVLSFDSLDDEAEAALAAEFAAHLESVLSTATGTVAIYHWSNVEVSRTARFPEVARLLEGRTFDLMTWLKQQFRARGAFSIKDVAPLFDFAWAVDDAGGFASMQVIEDARAGDEAARQWCRDYNESDVAAQAAIRDGLRARREAAGR